MDNTNARGLYCKLWPWRCSRAMVLSGPGLPLKAISWCLALQQSGSELISEVPVTSKDHADGRVLDRHFRPCWSSSRCCARAIPIWVAGAATWGMVTSGPQQLLRVMSRSMILQQLESVMMSVVCVSIGSHWNHAVLIRGSVIAGPATCWILHQESWLHPSGVN